VTLRLKSARQNYQNVLSIGINIPFPFTGTGQKLEAFDTLSEKILFCMPLQSEFIPVH